MARFFSQLGLGWLVGGERHQSVGVMLIAAHTRNIVQGTMVTVHAPAPGHRLVEADHQGSTVAVSTPSFPD